MAITEVQTPVVIQGVDTDEPARIELPVTKVESGTVVPDTRDWRPVGTTLGALSGRVEVEDPTSGAAEFFTAGIAGPSDQYQADREARVLQAMALGNPDHFKDEATADRLLLGLASSRSTFKVDGGKVGDNTIPGAHYQVRETLQPDGSYKFTLVEVAPPKAPPKVEPSMASGRDALFGETSGQLRDPNRVAETYKEPPGSGADLRLVEKDAVSGLWKPAAALPTDAAHDPHQNQAYYLAAYKHGQEMGLDEPAARVFARDFTTRNPNRTDGLAALHKHVGNYNLPESSTGTDASSRAHARAEMGKYATPEAYARSRAQGSGHEDEVADRLGKVPPDAQWAVAMGPDQGSSKTYWEAVFADSGESLIARDELPAGFKDKRKDEILAGISPQVDAIDRDMVDAQARRSQGELELYGRGAIGNPGYVKGHLNERPAAPAASAKADVVRDYKLAVAKWEAGRAAIEGRIAKADGDLRSAISRRVALRDRLLEGFADGDADSIKEATGGAVQLTDSEAETLEHQAESTRGGSGDKWLGRVASGTGILAQGTQAGVAFAGLFKKDAVDAQAQGGADAYMAAFHAKGAKREEIALNKSGQLRGRGQLQMEAAAAKIGQKKGSGGEALDAAVAGLATGTTKGITGDTVTASRLGPHAPGQAPEERAAARAEAKARRDKARRDNDRAASEEPRNA